MARSVGTKILIGWGDSDRWVVTLHVVIFSPAGYLPLDLPSILPPDYQALLGEAMWSEDGIVGVCEWIQWERVLNLESLSVLWSEWGCLVDSKWLCLRDSLLSFVISARPSDSVLGLNTVACWYHTAYCLWPYWKEAPIVYQANSRRQGKELLRIQELKSW